MKKIILFLFLFIAQSAFSQNSFKAIVNDNKSNEPLIGTNVFIESLKIGATTDTNGNVEIINIPNGTFTITFSYIGYKLFKLKLSFPSEYPEGIKIIYLEPRAIESEEVFVTSTRTNGVIDDVPVRVEVLGLEEVREETAIKPGNISKLLGETSGIQIQQTSATTGNVSFRIQGLQGKYTQLLKDGFPLYSGFSSGLSLLQIPPLDLLQVEVIKGSASALYGGDAIAGIVNLVSKEPSETPEWLTIINQTHKNGRDISSFYANRSDKTGITFLASQSIQNAFDVDKDGFSDIPEFQQTTLNPKFFYYFDDATTLMLGISSSFEHRAGGDIYAIQNTPDSLHSFIEKNKSNRTTSQLKFEKKYRNGNILTFKNSINDFQRDIFVTNNNFGGEQISSYSDLSYLLKTQKHNIVFGYNLLTDAFVENEKLSLTANSLDYNYYTVGFFAQDDWDITEITIFQTGLRIDYNNKYGTFFLPRFSALYKFSDKLHARIGYGSGYKIPTVFTSAAEAKAFKNVMPISSNMKSETSQGLNLDISYKFFMNEFMFTINQAFYYTKIYNALILQPDSLAKGFLMYENANSSLETKGFDTNIKVALDELVLFVDYTYTDVRKNYDKINPYLELTPKHKLNMTLTYEEEQSWRTGIEAFYTGKQYINKFTQSRDYWTIGFMIQKIFKNFSIIGNVENIFDVRQTKYERVVNKPYNNPTFKPIYAPLDGVVANVALELKIR
ncbi:TonB-dependent receptor [bacterium]|nr:TonB-dependent receptor [bacterium]MBU1064564.1 TonB-dependent receptor [bacterium]MBU1634438.1 TonB-dependent receptor [bacterium]MBU1874629.1 TonB-dependent receptor [bacterium]